MSLSLEGQGQVVAVAGPQVDLRVDRGGPRARGAVATPDEVLAHEALLAKIAKEVRAGGGVAVSVASRRRGRRGSGVSGRRVARDRCGDTQRLFANSPTAGPVAPTPFCECDSTLCVGCCGTCRMRTVHHEGPNP